MPQPTRPQLALYAAFAIAVLLVGGRFLRSGDASGGASRQRPRSAALPPAPPLRTAPAASPPAPAPPGSTLARRQRLRAGRGRPVSDAARPGRRGVTRRSAGGAGCGRGRQGAVRRPGVYSVGDGRPRARRGRARRRARRPRRPPRGEPGGESRRRRRGRRAATRRARQRRHRFVAGGGEARPGRRLRRRTGLAAADVPLALDINAASATELEQLDGVGPATAAKIVAYRDQHGPFGSIEELDAVSGIGEAKLAAIRTQLGR